MGLRFRKSVTLCKGVKVNFGKTGASLTLGQKGYHKTFHTSGKVTTTVGLPGTGIYWTETSNPKKNKGNRTTQETNYSRAYSNKNEENYGPADSSFDEPTWLTDEDVNNENVTFDSKSKIENYYPQDYSYIDNLNENRNNEIYDFHTSNVALGYDDINDIFRRCDESIDWGEILAGSTADELMMNPHMWSECKKLCSQIMAGDVDAYLQAIEIFKPVDDLLLYAGEFEFGSDSRTFIECEFRIKTEGISYVENNDLFKNFVFAVSIRVARDLMALLPISYVIIHVVYDGKTIFSVNFNRSKIVDIDFRRIGIKDAINMFEYNSGMEMNRLINVERKEIN